jgi:adenylosuccinate lyase
MQEQPTALRVPDPGVRALFGRDARWQAWLDVEVALAEAEAEAGMVPASAASEIGRKARIELLDMARILEGLRVTGHPLVPLVWELDRVCEGDAGGFIHWGATTQNITQTGDLLQLRKAHAIYLRQLGSVLTALADLADRSKGYLMAGRTHGQHAVPATFGLKVAAWIDELCRHVERLRGCEPRVFVAQLGGAAGTFASFGAKGPALQALFARKLGLTPMPVPSRTTADHEAEYVLTLAMLASTCAKLAREVYELMKEEFGEVEEPVPEGTVGSSTMPQKRNPKLSQDIIAAEASVRALVPLALEAMQAEHEADRARTVMMSRALHETCGLVGDILARLRLLIEGLQLFPERMSQNLDLSGGLIMAEAVMLELGAKIGRQRAHDAVYEAAQAAATGRGAFADLLAADPEVARHLSPAALRDLLDPARHAGLSSLLAEEQAARARRVAGELV